MVVYMLIRIMWCFCVLLSIGNANVTEKKSNVGRPTLYVLEDGRRSCIFNSNDFYFHCVRQFIKVEILKTELWQKNVSSHTSNWVIKNRHGSAVASGLELSNARNIYIAVENLIDPFKTYSYEVAHKCNTRDLDGVVDLLDSHYTRSSQLAILYEVYRAAHKTSHGQASTEVEDFIFNDFGSRLQDYMARRGYMFRHKQFNSFTPLAAPLRSQILDNIYTKYLPELETFILRLPSTQIAWGVWVHLNSVSSNKSILNFLHQVPILAYGVGPVWVAQQSILKIAERAEAWQFIYDICFPWMEAVRLECRPIASGRLSPSWGFRDIENIISQAIDVYSKACLKLNNPGNLPETVRSLFVIGKCKQMLNIVRNRFLNTPYIDMFRSSPEECEQLKMSVPSYSSSLNVYIINSIIKQNDFGIPVNILIPNSRYGIAWLKHLHWGPSDRRWALVDPSGKILEQGADMPDSEELLLMCNKHGHYTHKQVLQRYSIKYPTTLELELFSALMCANSMPVQDSGEPFEQIIQKQQMQEVCSVQDVYVNYLKLAKMRWGRQSSNFKEWCGKKVSEILEIVESTPRDLIGWEILYYCSNTIESRDFENTIIKYCKYPEGCAAIMVAEIIKSISRWTTPSKREILAINSLEYIWANIRLERMAPRDTIADELARLYLLCGCVGDYTRLAEDCSSLGVKVSHPLK